MRNRLSAFLAILLVATTVLCVIPTIKAQPPLPAIWIEPTTLNFNTTSTHVGDKFNVTVWAGTTSDVFTWQAEVKFNVTQLAAVRGAYTGTTGSQWFAGHTTVPVTIAIDNTSGTVIGGESLLGSDVVHASSGSLFWVEFQILIAPTSGNTLTSLIDTNDPTNSYLLDIDLNAMTGVALGNTTYVFSAGGPPPTRHDSAIVSLIPSNAHPVQNDTISIAVVALNNGTVTETFDVNVTYDGTLIGTQTATALAAGSTQTLTFSWNTTGVTPGPYTLLAKAAAVVGDADLSNNVKTAAVTVQSSVGPNFDLNGDGIVNMKDLGIVAKAFDTKPGDPRWNPICDLTGPSGVPDGKVDMSDITLEVKHLPWRTP